MFDGNTNSPIINALAYKFELAQNLFKDFFSKLCDELDDADSGQVDLITGKRETKDEILRRTLGIEPKVIEPEVVEPKTTFTKTKFGLVITDVGGYITPPPKPQNNVIAPPKIIAPEKTEIVPAQKIETSPKKIKYSDIKKLSKEERAVIAKEAKREKIAGIKNAVARFIIADGIDAPDGFISATGAKARLNRFSPVVKYSRNNLLIVLANNTIDARTYLEWKKAGRSVKKGAKAFHIYTPALFSSTEEDENGDAKLLACGLTAVFRYEDTEGKPLKYEPMFDIPAKATAQIAA